MPRRVPITAVRPVRLAGGAGLLLIVMSVLVLAGWALDSVALKSIRPGYVTMKPMTAVGFLLCGTGLFLLRRPPPETYSLLRRLGHVAALCTLLTGGVFTVQYITGWNLGLDQLLFRSDVAGEDQPYPGRMAPITAGCFLLAGAALLANENPRLYRLGAALEFILAAAALVAFTGYVYDARSLFTIATYESVAWHTAIGFIVASFGMLASRPDFGLAAAVSRPDAAGILVRRLLPAAILIPLVLGYVRLAGEELGLYSAQAGTAILMVANMFVFLSVLAMTTKAIISSEGHRSRLATIVDFAHDAIHAENEHGIIETWNPAAERLYEYTQREALGQSSLMLVPPESRDSFARITAQVRRAEPVENEDVTLQTRSGRLIEVSISSSPLLDRMGRFIGASYIARDITERRQMERALRQNQQELRALTSKLISAQEQEARRIARELHDAFSQNIAAVGMDLSAAVTDSASLTKRSSDLLHGAIGKLDDLARDIHQVSRQLHPSILDDLGLAAALESECERASTQTGVPVHCHVQPLRPHLPEMVALTLYRIAQEAISNAAKHSGAAAIEVRLEETGGVLRLAVTDQGTGFDVRAAREQKGLGLVSMEERARLAGGTLEIRSTPGKGACVEFVVQREEV